jgi:hypothetical protein
MRFQKRKKLEAARGGAGGEDDAEDAEGEAAEEPTQRAGGRSKLKKSRAVALDE